MADFSVNNSDIAQIQGMHSHKKAMLVVGLLVLFVLSMTFGRKMFQKSTNNAIPTPSVASPVETADQGTLAGKTTLSITPNTGTLAVGESTSFSVLLTGIPVSAIDLVVAFDPSVVSISNIVKGPLFDRILRSKVENGKIYFSGVINPDKLAQISEGEVVSFTATGIASGSNSPITLVQEDIQTALNGQNTLGSLVNAAVTVTK